MSIAVTRAQLVLDPMAVSWVDNLLSSSAVAA